MRLDCFGGSSRIQFALRRSLGNVVGAARVRGSRWRGCVLERLQVAFSPVDQSRGLARQLRKCFLAANRSLLRRVRLLQESLKVQPGPLSANELGDRHNSLLGLALWLSAAVVYHTPVGTSGLVAVTLKYRSLRPSFAQVSRRGRKIGEHHATKLDLGNLGPGQLIGSESIQPTTSLETHTCISIMLPSYCPCLARLWLPLRCCWCSADC
mmetsp:Transcript_4191/g.12127  ORF Transcript_4191/g.12127 Transcript_4191/m.12127 type:complete len:210 (-) Transcript_4191:664-1293(-)